MSFDCRLACLFLLASLLTAAVHADEPESKKPQPLKKAHLGSTPNVHAAGPVLLAGQPSVDDLALAKKKGVEVVVSLREADELTWDEKAVVEQLGLTYLHLPFNNPRKLTDEVFDEARKVLRASDESPVLLHCGAGIRVAPIWMAYRTLDENIPVDQVRHEAAAMGLRGGALQARADEYIAKQRQHDE